MTATSTGLALVVLAGLTAYAVLGGADFGAGLWDLTRNPRQRELLAKAMGPVWEANHVWLIFVVITLFSGFPGAFAALSRALVAPVSLALLGIVLRGAAFAFRQYGAPDGGLPVRGTVLWGRVFAISSLLTPFAFGAAAGAMATGALRADGSAGLWAPYLAPLPLVAGVLAVACCGFTAAVFLARDAQRIGDEALVTGMRHRALGAGLIAGALALAALPLLPPSLAEDLRVVGLPAVAVSATAGVAALLLLWRRRYAAARVATAAAPAGLLAGWALALHPWVLPGEVSLADSAAGPVTAGPILGVLLAGLAIVIPCYALMLHLLRSAP
ncbi:MAG: cytochrome d ubiquinol oxidase subunit II [Pseudonocardiaceae bacterium]|nr:cytochrome d ubiquinol oxidase subunit II [Pseudonocardiaceae bacterium]